MTSFKHFFYTAAIASTISTSAIAHHSFSATFQADARITRQGEVTKVIFKNPHVLIYFNVEENDGSITQWVGEGSSAIALRRSGWSADTVKVGDRVRIFGDSTHDGSPMVSLEAVWSLDGNGDVIETLKQSDEDVGGSPFDIPSAKEYHELPLLRADGTPNLEALWSYRLPAQTEGARLPTLPYSDAGSARKAAFDVRHDLQVFCDLPGAFRQIFQNPYPLKLTQGADTLTIEYEEYGIIREVPFADAPIDTGIKTRLGTSAARYEGNELVIETINFLENPGTTNGDYVSDQSRIVERFRRADDEEFGAIVEIDATVYDPVYLTEPYTVSRRKSIVGGYEYTPHECEAPLRERKVVSPYMSVFAIQNASADAQCQTAAEAVRQGDKGWVFATGAVPEGIYYSAKGEYLETRTTNIAANGDVLTGVAGQCYATKNFIAPVSSQTTPVTVAAPNETVEATRDEKGGSKLWFFILLGALIGTFAVFMFSRNKNKHT